MMKFFDVSIPIKESMIIYPGNPSPSITRYRSIPESSSNESIISIGSHTGTHVDSQMHIANSNLGVETLPLDSFYGKCKVLDLTHIGEEIHRSNLETYNISKGDIILLKTKNSNLEYNRFRRDYVYLKRDAAEYLVNVGVKTLGFDYLSVKKRGSDYEVHNILINNLTLFEGLNLSEVSAGEYVFIGLPLRINCDGAPARVLLMKDS